MAVNWTKCAFPKCEQVVCDNGDYRRAKIALKDGSTIEGMICYNSSIAHDYTSCDFSSIFLVKNFWKIPTISDLNNINLDNLNGIDVLLQLCISYLPGYEITCLDGIDQDTYYEIQVLANESKLMEGFKIPHLNPILQRRASFRKSDQKFKNLVLKKKNIIFNCVTGGWRNNDHWLNDDVNDHDKIVYIPLLDPCDFLDKILDFSNEDSIDDNEYFEQKDLWKNIDESKDEISKIIETRNDHHNYLFSLWKGEVEMKVKPQSQKQKRKHSEERGDQNLEQNQDLRISQFPLSISTPNENRDEDDNADELETNEENIQGLEYVDDYDNENESKLNEENLENVKRLEDYDIDKDNNYIENKDDENV